MNNNRYALWFRWAVFIGIAQDWLVALPGIFIPNAVLGLVSEPVAQPVWPAFACLLLFLLSLMYIPGALDPLTHRGTAILTVVSRAKGVFFFLILWRGQTPGWFGYLDLTFTVVQGLLLWLTYREARRTLAVAIGQKGIA